jgi:hypothetical protein
MGILRRGGSGDRSGEDSGNQGGDPTGEVHDEVGSRFNEGAVTGEFAPKV